MSIVSSAILLFLVMDPLGNLPVFASILREVPEKRRPMVLLRETIVALIVLLAFLLAGQHLLHLLGVKPPALSISGGVILFVISILMVFPIPGAFGHSTPREPFIVPLAIPMIAGPSAMTTLLILSSQTPLRHSALALIIAWVAVATILMLSGLLQRILGPRGLEALERLMGMLLIVLAVQMFLDGVRAFMTAG